MQSTCIVLPPLRLRRPSKLGLRKGEKINKPNKHTHTHTLTSEQERRTKQRELEAGKTHKKVPIKAVSLTGRKGILTEFTDSVIH